MNFLVILFGIWENSVKTKKSLFTVAKIHLNNFILLYKVKRRNYLKNSKKNPKNAAGHWDIVIRNEASFIVWEV